MGLSRTSTEEAMKLPGNITFSYSPYSGNLKEWFERAKEKNNQTLLDIPLEPSDYPISDPGPYALLTTLSKEDNLGRLRTIFSLGDGYTGIRIARGDKFSSSLDDVTAVFKEIKDKNLFVVFSGDIDFQVENVMKNLGIKYIKADDQIDEKLSKEVIFEKLTMLEATALEKGYAVAMARPYPLTVKVINQWMQTLKDKNIEIVQISALNK